MVVKLLMTWDIAAGREQDYFEFVVREFVPGMQRLGLEPSDAWYTLYGEHQPQIMAGAVAATLPALKAVLQSNEWKFLVNQLLDFVENFSYKIVTARGGFQI